MRTNYLSILTFPGLMARLPALVGSAFQLLPTRQSAPSILKPTRLIFENPLATDTRPFHQKGALGASHIVWMTLMGHCRMSAWPRSATVKSALWRSGSAWLRRVQYSSPARAADLVKDSLRASIARPPVT